MSCRDSRFSSAMVTFARDMSGLADHQVLALSHALMREGAHTPLRSDAWGRLIDQTQEAFRDGTLTITRGSHDPVSRLESARTETPSAGRIYAAERLVTRAVLAQEAHTAYLEGAARNTGLTMDQVTRVWEAHRPAAAEARTAQVSAGFLASWNANPDHANLFVDRRSLYGYEQMELQRARAIAAALTRPAVNSWTPVECSSLFTQVGYDPEGQRLELIRHDGTRTVGQLSPERYAVFLEAATGSPNAAHNRVRYVDIVSYRNVEEAAAAAVHRQCATCGRFVAAVSHTCPVPGSPASLAADVNLATAAATVAAASAVAASEPADAPPAPVSVSPVRLLSQPSLRHPPRGRISIRATGLERTRVAVLNAARDNAAIITELHATHNGLDLNVLRGDVLVDRADGSYRVSAAPSLQCDCSDYRRDYRCVHTENTMTEFAGLLNGLPVDPAIAVMSATETLDVLQGEHAASVAATTASTAGFQPLTTSFVDDPAAFQGLYNEMRATRTAHAAALLRGETPDYPVPYLSENVFGGLAKRGSGRGFGIEIEYAYPATMSWEDKATSAENIGEALYAAGLTRDAYQDAYGASHGWSRDHHARGWSFEEDGTTGGSDAAAGGEIVSPIMYDEADTWTNLTVITDILKANGAIVSKGASMHAHVSNGDYDHRLENHNRLLNSFAANEDLFYRLSANPERGRHRGQEYCAPNRMPASAYTDVGRARRDHDSHYVGVNMQSVSGLSSDHVEFRTFDATLNPAVMQAQLALAVYLTEGATRAGTSDPVNLTANHTPVGGRLASNPTREPLTGEAWTASTLPMRQLLDRFVPGAGGNETENPRVRQLVALFAMTKWQKARRARNY